MNEILLFYNRGLRSPVSILNSFRRWTPPPSASGTSFRTQILPMDLDLYMSTPNVASQRDSPTRTSDTEFGNPQTLSDTNTSELGDPQPMIWLVTGVLSSPTDGLGYTKDKRMTTTMAHPFIPTSPYMPLFRSVKTHRIVSLTFLPLLRISFSAGVPWWASLHVFNTSSTFHNLPAWSNLYLWNLVMIIVLLRNIF